MLIMFDAKQPYYLPQYLPVVAELVSRGVQCEVVIHGGESAGEIAARSCDQANINYLHVSSESEATAVYQHRKPAWIIFGNNFDSLDKLPEDTKTVLLYHGIGRTITQTS